MAKKRRKRKARVVEVERRVRRGQHLMTGNLYTLLSQSGRAFIGTLALQGGGMAIFKKVRGIKLR